MDMGSAGWINNARGDKTGAAMGTHSRAGVEKRLGGRIQWKSRQRSAARHNVKNGAV